MDAAVNATGQSVDKQEPVSNQNLESLSQWAHRFTWWGPVSPNSAHRRSGLWPSSAACPSARALRGVVIGCGPNRGSDMPDADPRQDRFWGLASSAQRAPGADIDFVTHAFRQFRAARRSAHLRCWRVGVLSLLSGDLVWLGLGDPYAAWMNLSGAPIGLVVTEVRCSPGFFARSAWL